MITRLTKENVQTTIEVLDYFMENFIGNTPLDPTSEKYRYIQEVKRHLYSKMDIVTLIAYNQVMQVIENDKTR